MNFYIDNDKRNEIVAAKLQDNYLVYSLDKLHTARAGDVIIFAPNKKFTAEELNTLPTGVTLICGNIDDKLTKILKKRQILHENLLKNEEFAIKNANLTAEGALALTLTHSKKSIYNSKILLLGNGRIATALAVLLGKLGANFAMCSFNQYSFDHNYIYTSRNIFGNDLPNQIADFDIIINTIPAKIIDSATLNSISPGVLFIETASTPCLDSATNLHFNYLPAPALPQKFSADDAGLLLLKIIKKSLKLS